MDPIAQTVPHRLANRLIWLPDRARLNGIHAVAGSGAGKSRMLGRVIAFLDFLRGTPLILIDPTGGTWANLADRILRLPPKQQQVCWARIVYVDMSGRGDYITPLPLLTRQFEGESLYTTSQRYLEVVRRVDPALAQASVEGLNALSRLWTYAAMVLTTLGLQVTEVEPLIRTPELWADRLAYAQRLNPEVAPAVDFFRDFMQWPLDLRLRRADALLIKLMPFTLDPAMAALFGASTPAFRWDEMINQGKALVLDFRHELNPERRRFKLLWVFLSAVEYLKQRGLAGRQRPVSFIIDEVTQLLGYGSDQSALLAEDLEELVSVIARNYGIRLTIAHQNLAQVPERVRTMLMAMGTQIVGVMQNPEDALYLARQFVRYNPKLVKKREPVWMGVADPSVIGAVSVPTIIDQRTVEYTAEEQFLLMADKLRSLRRFRFLVRVAQGEGNIAGTLRPMSIANLDRGLYPEERWIAQLEQRLLRRDGVPLERILAEIAARRQDKPATARPGKPTRPPAPKAVATIKDDAHPLPLFTQEEFDDDDFESLRDDA